SCRHNADGCDIFGVLIPVDTVYVNRWIDNAQCAGNSALLEHDRCGGVTGQHCGVIGNCGFTGESPAQTAGGVFSYLETSTLRLEGCQRGGHGECGYMKSFGHSAASLVVYY